MSSGMLVVECMFSTTYVLIHVVFK